MWKYKSNAKINLGLQVLNRRADDYHNIKSIFLEVDIFDTILFQKSNKYKLEGTGIPIPYNSTNLISKAYDIMVEQRKNYVDDFLITINKKIPIGAGLGGGSSNAATTLKVLNKLWDINFDNEKLIRLGKDIGADVPFFIFGGAQQVSGIGEKLKKIKIKFLKDYFILVVYPQIHISTKWAYSKMIKHLPSNKNNNKFPSLLNKGNLKLLENDFEKVVFRTYPEISKIKQALIDSGAVYASLSGSGSAMFGFFSNMRDLIKSQKLLKSYQSKITSPVMR